MFDAVGFCRDYNIDYREAPHKNVSDGWVGINDPFETDTGFHMGINVMGNYAYSWKGGRGYSLVDVLQELLHIGYGEARKVIDAYSTETSFTPSIQAKQRFSIVDTPTTPAIRNFLRRRRYNAKRLVEKYDLRGDGYKLVIPIYYDKQIVSYQTRDIREKAYIGCDKDRAIINYKNIVYPIDNAKDNHIVVVEGIFDAYRLGDGAVCTFGTSWTKHQVNLIASRYEHVIIRYDAEPLAQKKARALAIELEMMGCNAHVEHEFLEMMGCNDPDELTDKQAQAFMKYIRKYI